MSVARASISRDIRDLRQLTQVGRKRRGHAVQGTIAVTDYGWDERLGAEAALDEVNFWEPSAGRTFQADEFSPFIFKLRKGDDEGICRVGVFARYSSPPDCRAGEP